VDYTNLIQPLSLDEAYLDVTANRRGIETGADLRDKSLAFLQQNFGSSAEWYYLIARGIDERPVNPDRERKSSGAETTFDRDLLEDQEIEAGVLRQADDVWNWCEKAQEFGRTVTVKVKYGDFQNITRSRTQPALVTTQEVLRDASLALIRSVLPTEKGIRHVGVTVSNFDRSLATAGERCRCSISRYNASSRISGGGCSEGRARGGEAVLRRRPRRLEIEA
jgi:nucleotidyltransferase/DNA polymerase involved in DNA repair